MPLGQIRSTACFWTAHEPRMIFASLYSFKKSKEDYFTACANWVTFKFQCPYIKLYWNTTMLIPLLSFSGCFLASRAELSICCTAHNVLNIYSLTPYRKRLLTSSIKEFIKAWTYLFLVQVPWTSIDIFSFLWYRII